MSVVVHPCIDSFYVKSSVKLLPEIKLLLQTNPTCERIFRRTIFGPWLDIPSHENDTHLMHYVLQHQFGQKEFCIITGFRFGILSEKHKKLSPFCQCVFPEKVTKTGVKKVKSSELLKLLRDKEGWLALSDMDAVRVYLLIVVELVFMGKEDRNCILRHIVSLVKDLDEWNYYPWGEYLWDKFYKRTVNVVTRHGVHHLAEKKNLNFNATYNLYGFAWAFKVLIPNVGLYSPLAYMREPWFIASIPFINGLVDEDRNIFLKDYVGVSKDNVVDGATPIRNPKSDNVKQSANVSIAKLFAEVRTLRQEVALIKVDDERIANVERLFKEKLQNDCATQKTKPDMIPNHFEDIQNCSVPDVTSNHTVVDQGLGGSSNDPMSTCSRPDMDNVEVACDGMSIDKADGKNKYTYSQVSTSTLDILIKAFDYSNYHPKINVL
ncbi:phospholipase-like protein [Tanacetum coccineum]